MMSLSMSEKVVISKLLNSSRRNRTESLHTATSANLDTFPVHVILDAVFNQTALRCLGPGEGSVITSKTIAAIESLQRARKSYNYKRVEHQNPIVLGSILSKAKAIESV
jgi:hypothetical protein